MSFYTYEVGALMDISGMAQTTVAVIDPLSAQASIAMTGSLTPMLAQLKVDLAMQEAMAVFLGKPGVGWGELVLTVGKFGAVITGPQLSFSGQLTACLNKIAELKLKIDGLESAIQALLDVNKVAIDFSGDISAQLSAGPVKVVGWEGPGSDSATVASQLSSALSTFTGDTYGAMLVTQSHAAWSGIKFMLKATG